MSRLFDRSHTQYCWKVQGYSIKGQGYHKIHRQYYWKGQGHSLLYSLKGQGHYESQVMVTVGVCR